MTYQGHKNWNHWNVAIWLFNDRYTYLIVKGHVDVAVTPNGAARRILHDLWRAGRLKTPDGAPYTFTSVRAALVGWES